MKSNEKRNGRLGTYWIAGIFIAVGLLMLGKNLEVITSEVFNLIVSWQSVLIVLGIYFLAKKHFLRSFVLIAVGAYFMITSMGVTGGITVFFWPVVLIAVGIIFLVKKGSCPGKSKHRSGQIDVEEYVSEDGYFNIESRYGGVHQIIMDEVVKGGKVHAYLGAVVLDLRRTSLPQGITYIDMDVSYGGVEIYMPSNWKIKSELKSFIGGFEDSRVAAFTAEPDRLLVLRGKVSVGGVEIKG